MNKNLQYIQENMPQIIEYFVKFYGEQYRDRIVNRFNNIAFVFDRSTALEEEIAKNKEYLKFVEERAQNAYAKVLKGADENYVRERALDLHDFLKRYPELSEQDRQRLFKIYKHVSGKPLAEFDKWSKDLKEKISFQLGNAISSKKIKLRAELKEQFDKEVFDELERIDVFGGKILYEILQRDFYEDGNMGGAAVTSCKSSDQDQITFICGLATIDSLTDQMLIHELNHIFDSDLIRQGDKFIFNTNFVVRKCCIDKDMDYFKEINSNSFKIGILSEIFNDYIATEIANLMHKDGYKIFDNPEFLSIYSAAFPVIKDFVEANRELFVKPSLNKYQLIKNLSGEQNLDKLSKLLNDFINYDYRIGEKVMPELCQIQFGRPSGARKLDFDKLISMLDDDKFSDDAKKYLMQMKDIKELLAPFSKKSKESQDNIYDENDML